ncbi:MAG: hypothetical protein DCC75_02225, partial [Proteobacteria bacterium]
MQPGQKSASGRNRVNAWVLTLCSVILLYVQICESEESQRTNLGLYGCTVTGLTVSPDGSVAATSCTGPKGLFLSKDLGGTWHYAQGGVYEDGGGASSIASTSNGIYAHTNSMIIYTTVSEAAALAPKWRTLEAPQSSISFVAGASLVTSGKFILSSWRSTGGSTTGFVAVLDTSNNSWLSPLKSLPEGIEAISIAQTGAKIFVVTTNSQTYAASSNQLYEADFNESTGTVGNFSDITSRLPSTLGGGTSAYPANVSTVGSSKILATISNDSAVYQGFLSTNNGGTFSQVLPVDEDGLVDSSYTYYSPDLQTIRSKGCFRGNSII